MGSKMMAILMLGLLAMFLSISSGMAARDLKEGANQVGAAKGGLGGRYNSRYGYGFPGFGYPGFPGGGSFGPFPGGGGFGRGFPGGGGFGRGFPGGGGFGPGFPGGDGFGPGFPGFGGFGPGFPGFGGGQGFGGRGQLGGSP